MNEQANVVATRVAANLGRLLIELETKQVEIERLTKELEEVKKDKK